METARAECRPAETTSYRKNALSSGDLVNDEMNTQDTDTESLRIWKNGGGRRMISRKRNGVKLLCRPTGTMKAVLSNMGGSKRRLVIEVLRGLWRLNVECKRLASQPMAKGESLVARH